MRKGTVNMKRAFKTVIATCLMCASVVSVASATDFAKGESGYGENGKYMTFWPKTGSLTATYSSSKKTATTKLSFTYGDKTVKYFDEVYWPENLYPGVEIRDFFDAPAEGNFSAPTVSAIVTNLPDPKFDVEDDDILHHKYNEEAEVTALGKTIKAGKEYYMQVVWDDHRTSESMGCFGAKAELSKKGVIDYNVVDYKYLNADVPYNASVTNSTLSTVLQNTNSINIDVSQEVSTPITVTFREYVPFETFTSYTQETSIDPVAVQLRGFDSSGDRITVFIYTNKALEQFQTTVTDLAKENAFSIVGITAAYAYADNHQIEELKQNTDVYSVEAVSPSTTNSIDLEATNLQPEFLHPQTWRLEDCGILKP